MADQQQQPGEAERALPDALAALDRAYRGAVAAITATPDPQRAFEGATRLAAELGDMRGATMALRARAAVRIKDGEALSLAGLAQRIGVSKARAGQLVEAASVDQAGEAGGGER